MCKTPFLIPTHTSYRWPTTSSWGTDTLEEELRSGCLDPVHEKLYRKYYSVTETPVRGIRLHPKQEAIDTAQQNYGTFTLISNDIKDL